MTLNLKNYFTPNYTLSKTENARLILVWLVATIGYWFWTDSKIVPDPSDVFLAMKKLVVEDGLPRDIITSTILCFRAMFWAIVFSFIIAYSYIIPVFRPFVAFAGKARFLTTIGLTFLFSQIFDTGGEKQAMLVFGIVVFLVTSASAVVSSVTKEEMDYARTLKMNEWQVAWEVIILGKADQMLEVIRQNFAMAWMLLAMVENLCRADGGIGIILNDSSKRFRYDEVYAVQIIVLALGMFFDYLLSLARQIICPYAYLILDKK